MVSFVVCFKLVKSSGRSLAALPLRECSRTYVGIFKNAMDLSQKVQTDLLTKIDSLMSSCLGSAPPSSPIISMLSVQGQSQYLEDDADRDFKINFEVMGGGGGREVTKEDHK